MIPGLSGTLLSHEALEEHLASIAGGLDASRARTCRRAIRDWQVPARERLGPAAGARTVFDEIAAPLFSALGFRVRASGGAHGLHTAVLQAGAEPSAALVVTGWGRDPESAWRDAVRQSLAFDVPWCFVLNGAELRIHDARRTYSRRYAGFVLDHAIDDERAFEVFWHLLRAGGDHGLRGPAAALDRAAAISEAHRADIREVLQRGVENALVRFTAALRREVRHSRRAARRPRRCERAGAGDEALVIIYRILFLLFAEARGLVPRWHPIYRDGYMVEALAERAARREDPRGLWESLQAVARLAHRGCRIGGLHVPPFNGRLFSPSHSPVADRARLADRPVRDALLALTTRTTARGRIRVSYGDLGVEQLGGIYERVLDFDPGAAAPRAADRRQRKSTGSFYTPRSLTEFVVRRTLAPLVRDLPSEGILALRVLDPAMGSGAFLVSACRFLASAYEAALAREGVFATGDVTEPERIAFRRVVAQRCLYGVDLNPMAVQLGRLSLWLTTLAADRPLTFLDHRLRTGNSLIGASLEDMARQPPGGRSRTAAAPLPLFDGGPFESALQRTVHVLRGIAAAPDDTLEQVRWKERSLAAATDESSALARWKSVADAWCAAWFRADIPARSAAAAFGAIADARLGRHSALPPRTLAALLDETGIIADRHRFFHWTLEFPDVFFDGDGARLATPGFDAILTNPPWEVLREDAHGRGEDASARRGLVRFARGSGIYNHQGHGHANLYQLFVERSLALTREGGRVGIVLPWGFASDSGSAALRRALLDRTRLDPLVSVENRAGVFRIHRSLRFLLLSATKGGTTDSIVCRFGLPGADDLDRIPDSGGDPRALVMSRDLIERIGGVQVAIPDLRLGIDVEIFGDVASRHPALGDPQGWHLRFGRELNATDHRRHFFRSDGRPGAGAVVVEGKHLRPFRVDLDASDVRIRHADAARLLGGPRPFDRPRLGYRDVASPTNRISLIAAIIPAGAVTTHTVFCLKTALDEDTQHFLCGMLNSFAANYLLRPRITTHVSAAIIHRLPLPVVPRGSRPFAEIATLARRLSRGGGGRTLAALNARAALAYGLSRAAFAHVLGTFPLVPEASRHEALRAFCDIVT